MLTTQPANRPSEYNTVNLMGYRLVVRKEPLTVSVFKVITPNRLKLITRLQGRFALQRAIFQIYGFALFLTAVQFMFGKDGAK